MNRHLLQTLKSIPLYSLSKGSARISSDKPEYNGDFTVIKVGKIYNVSIEHNICMQPSFSSTRDIIEMPLKTQYSNSSHYHFDLFHELNHAVALRNYHPTMVQSAFALSIYQKSVGNVEVDISKLNQKLRIGTSLNSSEKDLLIPLVKEEFKANTVAVALLKSYNFPITNEIKAYYADSIKNLITVSELAGKDFLVEINDKTSIYHQDTATLYDMMRELTKECEKLNPKSKGGMEL